MSVFCGKEGLAGRRSRQKIKGIKIVDKALFAGKQMKKVVQKINDDYRNQQEMIKSYVSYDML